MKWTSAECFAGIGAWGKALKIVSERHGDENELKYYFEIDKYASNAFSAIHDVSEDLNKWDITQDAEVPEVDVFFYSPPCQTFSIAGKKEGRTVAKGNLFNSALEKLKKSRPKFAIMENVANLANQFKSDYIDMIKDLEKAGYINYSKILNSKHYGIPQNRERVFIASIRKDIYNQGIRFEWPQELELMLRLKDMLQDNVPEKYYLSQKMIECFTKHTESQNTKGNGFKFEPTEGDCIASAVITKAGSRADDNFIKVQSATNCGYEIAGECDSINLDQPNSKTRRGRVGVGVAQTLTTSCNQAVVLQVGQIVNTDSFGGNPQRGRIYSTEGIAPALNTAQGGGLETKIVEFPCIAASRGRNPSNPLDRTVGAPTEQRLELNENGTSNTLTSVQKDNLVIEYAEPKLIGGIGEINFGTQHRQGNRVYDSDGVAMCLLSSPVGNAGGNSYLYQEPSLRIRKLTPLECFRLQGFSDEDYFKAVQAYEKKWKPGKSDAQMYIRAGNSITVNVIVEILENLLYQRKQSTQITMF